MESALLTEPTTGEEIRKAREAAGLSQSELARVAGVSRQTVINYERGRVPRSGRTLIHVREVLTRLLNDEGRPESALAKNKPVVQDRHAAG